MYKAMSWMMLERSDSPHLTLTALCFSRLCFCVASVATETLLRRRLRGINSDVW